MRAKRLLAGEVLEVKIVDPALAHAFVGERIDVLQQQQTDHEAGLGSRPPGIAELVGQFTVEPVSVDRVGQAHKLVALVDDLIEPRPEQITRAALFRLSWSHRCSPRCTQRLTGRRSRESPVGTKYRKVPAPNPRNLQFPLLHQPENRFLIRALGVAHGELLCRRAFSPICHRPWQSAPGSQSLWIENIPPSVRNGHWLCVWANRLASSMSLIAANIESDGCKEAPGSIFHVRQAHSHDLHCVDVLLRCRYSSPTFRG